MISVKARLDKMEAVVESVCDINVLLCYTLAKDFTYAHSTLKVDKILSDLVNLYIT